MLKIIVAMSGGVDSSVSALLLKKQHCVVEGLFMKNWDEDDGSEQCTHAEDFLAAAQVCATLDIPLHTVSFAREYREQVFEHFLQEHREGRTPNPDILCNREIKFRAFVRYAFTQLGADKIATGHYARIRHKPNTLELLGGTDTRKDQSYFLYDLDTKQLQNVLFPIGGMVKSTVRHIAKEAGLVSHDRPDSTGICFIGERHFRNFLEQYLPRNPGPIIDLHGNKLGLHDGAHYYTLGQRRGLGIGGKSNGAELPWYVVAKDMSANQLVVAQGVNHPALFKHQLQAKKANWIGDAPKIFPLKCSAKIRYRSDPSPCALHQEDDKTLTVHFEQAQRAITPGQSVVFYADEVCLGGAVINHAVN